MSLFFRMAASLAHHKLSDAERLPSDILGSVSFGGMLVTTSPDLPHCGVIYLDGGLPDAVASALIGRRLGDFIDHRLLHDHPFLDAHVVRVDVNASDTKIAVDRVLAAVHAEHVRFSNAELDAVHGGRSFTDTLPVGAVL